MLAVVGLFAAIVLGRLAPETVEAQAVICGGASMSVEGGDPSPFVLPRDSGSTVTIPPDSVLFISASDTGEPPDRREIRLSIVAFGYSIDAITEELDPVPGSAPVRVDVGEELPDIARGLFQVEGTLIDDGVEVCTVGFNVRVGEFGGPVVNSAAAASAVAGAGALAGVPLAANGMTAKLNAKVQLQRRRPRGWRRVFPVPAWKRTLFSMVTGAITGLALTVVLQQAAVTPLDMATAIWGMVSGGGISFGIGYSIGAVRTYLQAPVDPEERVEESDNTVDTGESDDSQ